MTSIPLCKLSKKDLHDFLPTSLSVDFRCQCIRADGSNQICGEPLGNHPDAPATQGKFNIYFHVIYLCLPSAIYQNFCFLCEITNMVILSGCPYHSITTIRIYFQVFIPILFIYILPELFWCVLCG